VPFSSSWIMNQREHMHHQPFTPLDVESITEGQTRAWQDSFSWPVASPAMYNTILRDLDVQYRAILRVQTIPFVREVLVVRYKLLLEFANLLYSTSVVQHFRERGVIMTYAQHEGYWHYVIRDIYPVDGFHMRPHRISRSFSMRDQLQQGNVAVRMDIKHRLRTRRWFPSSARGAVYVFQPNHFTLEYLVKSYDGRVRFLRNADVVGGGAGTIPGDAHAACAEATRDIARSVMEIAKQHGIILSAAAQQYVSSLTSTTCTQSLKDIAMVMRATSQLDAGCRMYMTTPGRYDRRVVGAAMHLRGDGSRTFGFAHGEYTGHDASAHYIAINFGNVDELGVFSEPSLPLVRAGIDRFPEYVRSGSNVFPIETSFFSDLANRYATNPTPLRIRRVMVIGVAYSKRPTFITKDLASPLVNLDFERRIIEALQANGYEVVYKAHPSGRLPEPLRASGAQINTAPFEGVTDEADIYVFHRPMTTTFLAAFCTKKPIVYLQNTDVQRDWGADEELIAARCRIVPTQLDERNRIIFDKAELSEAIAARPSEPDQRFLERYCFPTLDPERIRA
jgi:hypothetical protein